MTNVQTDQKLYRPEIKVSVAKPKNFTKPVLKSGWLTPQEETALFAEIRARLG